MLQSSEGAAQFWFVTMQISTSSSSRWCDEPVEPPRSTLSPSVRSCPRQPHPPVRFPPDTPPSSPPPPGAFTRGPSWLTAVDLDLSITRQIKEGFRTHSCCSPRSVPASNPRLQTQFPGTGLLQGPSNEVIPSTHDWVRLPPHHHHHRHHRCRRHHNPRSPLTF